MPNIPVRADARTLPSAEDLMRELVPALDALRNIRKLLDDVETEGIGGMTRILDVALEKLTATAGKIKAIYRQSMEPEAIV